MILALPARLETSPMAQAALNTLSFEQYLHYSDRTDTRYELVRGYFVPLPPDPTAKLPNF